VALLARIGNPLLSAADGNIIGTAGFLVALAIVGRFLEKRTLAQYGLAFNQIAGVEFTLGLIAGALLMSAVFAFLCIAGWIHVEGGRFTALAADGFAWSTSAYIVRYLFGTFFE